MSGKNKRFRPTIPVTIHHDDGKIEVEKVDLSKIYREKDTNVQEQQLPETEIPGMDGVDDNEDMLDENINDSDTTSDYYKKAEKKQKAWENLRTEAISKTFQFAGRSRDMKCIHCGMDGSFRCKDCGFMAVFCEECMQIFHTTSINFYHHVEILKDGVFWPFKLPSLLIFDCQCDTVRHTRNVTVVNEKCVLSDFNVQFCCCCPEFVQLLQFGIWGGTPSKPRTAFAIEFLELVHAIQMECHASLKSICEAFELSNCNKITRSPASRKMYPVIIDAFEEYRLYRHRLNTLTCIIPELDKGDTCPACPKTVGPVFESLDALFIGRRKNAGQSVGRPLFGELMFYNQPNVDQFVAQYNSPAVNIEDCHNFLAGDAVRSINRYKALDETAIFGRGCRHEFPKKFLNLKHGERLSYAVWILTDLEKEVSEKPSIKINILYDIACMLTQHLQNRDEDSLLDLFQFAIPIFHCYGHNGQCQVKFSPRRKEGFGLTDGEMLERLWSYVRGFAKMTKEMRPSHRIDVLTDALLHYGSKTVRKIGIVLVERLKKAVQLEKDSERDIKNICDCIDSHSFDIQAIRVWINDEVNLFENEFQTDELSWSCKYVVYLDLYNNLHERWRACQDPHQLTVRYKQMKKIDDILISIERESSVHSRWTSDDQLYRNAKNEVVYTKTKKQLLRIRTRIVERWFLLGLKSKYSDGQSLAKRLAKQINRVTKQVKKEIDAFNNEDRASVQNLPSNITFEPVKDPDGELWLTLQPAYAEARESEIAFVPLSVKRKAIDLCHLLDRSREEKVMLKDEMENTWKHFSRQHELISDFLLALDNNDDALYEEYGAQLFARKKLLVVEWTLSALNESFAPYIDVEMPQTYIFRDPALAFDDCVDNTTAEEEEEQIIVSGNVILSDSETNSDSEYDSDGDFVSIEEYI